MLVVATNPGRSTGSVIHDRQCGVAVRAFGDMQPLLCNLENEFKIKQNNLALAFPAIRGIPDLAVILSNLFKITITIILLLRRERVANATSTTLGA